MAILRNNRSLGAIARVPIAYCTLTMHSDNLFVFNQLDSANYYFAEYLDNLAMNSSVHKFIIYLVSENLILK